ncbi:MAG: MBOAT family protein [Ruminococcaceae bacterium]|nr:MBOAT family protein [Oscillospiraceae bacterium]
MVFSSIPFLFYFLPVLLPCYFLVPRPAKNIVLLLFSLIFYAVGEPVYILLMLFSITQSYLLVNLSEKDIKRRKLWFVVTVILSVLPLVWYKYAGFLTTNLNLLPGVNLPVPKHSLPIGISFYTFQLIGYAADVYMKRCPAQKNPLHLALYVSLFPQLIAGPIVRYADVAEQLTTRTHSVEKFTEGILRFSVGLGKKVLIANVLGELCKSLGTSMLGVWGYATASALQIYYDFSGYSDMAIGLGRMFGFEIMENFNYPYISKSVAEFWRRWHMSLGSWFRDYIYIPMGGNRVSKPRWMFNILTVWMLTGLWHGAEWTFVLWGLYFAVFLVLEKLLAKYIAKIPAVLNRILVLFIVMVSFMIFDSPTIAEAFRRVVTLFDFTNPADTASLYYLRSYAGTLAAAIVGATPLLRNTAKKLAASESRTTQNVRNILVPVFICAVLIVSTAYLVDGSYNPFLYFRF